MSCSNVLNVTMVNFLDHGLYEPLKYVPDSNKYVLDLNKYAKKQKSVKICSSRLRNGAYIFENFYARIIITT